MNTSKLAWIPLLLALVLSGCPSPSDGRDTTAPTASSALEAEPWLAAGGTVVVAFSEPMEAGSQVLGGNMAAEGGGSWSGGDTLTISPATAWTTGAARTLTVAARDAAGNLSPTLALELHVVEAFVHVSATGDDANDGSEGSPLLTVQAAIAGADADYATALVKVSGGTYAFDSNTGGRGFNAVVLAEGICLRGGYNQVDWNERDPEAFETILRDTTSTAAGSSATANLNRTLFAPTSVTAATAVEGFTVEASPTDFNAALYLAGSPTIRGNRIVGGSFPGPRVTNETSRGILCTNLSTPRIEANRISGGSGQQHFSYAIENLQASPSVLGNVLFGGTGFSQTRGVLNGQDSTPLIANNLIHGGRASISAAVSSTLGADAKIFNNTVYGVDYGISLWNSDPDIRNNIILVEAGGIGIWEEDVDSDPWVRNNLIHGGAALYRDENATNVTSVSGVSVTTADGTTTLAAWGNLSLDPALADPDGADDGIDTMGDNDWQLGAATPAAVTGGGADLSADYPLLAADHDGRARTVPWSIGAHER